MSELSNDTRRHLNGIALMLGTKTQADIDTENAEMEAGEALEALVRHQYDVEDNTPFVQTDGE